MEPREPVGGGWGAWGVGRGAWGVRVHQLAKPKNQQSPEDTGDASPLGQGD